MGPAGDMGGGGSARYRSGRWRMTLGPEEKVAKRHAGSKDVCPLEGRWD
jgi:hypothetical protein